MSTDGCIAAPASSMSVPLSERLVSHGGFTAASKAYVSSARLALALFVLLTIAAASCSPRSQDPPPRFPMLLVGVDGMEWSVMKPLLAEGKLPVLQGLMDRGVHGTLTSMSPTFSPVIWTSIATGKVPAKHGIENFVYSVGGREDQVRVYTSGHRKTKAFWNILSDHGMTVDCVGWWITYPAEKIHGVMVSQTNTTAAAHNQAKAIWKGSLLKGVPGQVTPPERQNEVLHTLEEMDRTLPEITNQIFGRRPHPMDPFGRLLWDETQWAFRADATYIRVAKKLLESPPPPDLLAVYIGGTDVVSHRFWRYAHPELYAHPPSEEQVENFRSVIEDYYVYTDRAIGELLSKLPADVTVMVVSDHGFGAVNHDRDFAPEDPPFQRNSGAHDDAPPGVFIAAGRYIAAPPPEPGGGAPAGKSPLRTIGSVLDVMPTLLALKGIPIGEDMDGRPLTSLIQKERLEAAPPTFVPTHDSGEWLDARTARSGQSADDAERLEQLRSLGYIR